MCRWPSSAKKECGSICAVAPCAKLDTVNCKVIFDTTICGSGWWAISVVLEDYRKGSTVPMSSVGIQFLVSALTTGIACPLA